MKISMVKSFSISPCGGVSIDEEYRRILEKLKALGITPTGNKTVDKAKLREIEMRQLRAELNSNGNIGVSASRFLTISPDEINQLCDKLKEENQQNASEFSAPKETIENLAGAEQEAILKRYYIKKRGSVI